MPSSAYTARRASTALPGTAGMGTFAFGATDVRYVVWLSVATTRSVGVTISVPGDEPEEAHDHAVTGSASRNTGNMRRRISDPRPGGLRIRYCRDGFSGSRHRS